MLRRLEPSDHHIVLYLHRGPGSPPLPKHTAVEAAVRNRFADVWDVKAIYNDGDASTVLQLLFTLPWPPMAEPMNQRIGQLVDDLNRKGLGAVTRPTYVGMPCEAVIIHPQFMHQLTPKRLPVITRPRNALVVYGALPDRMVPRAPVPKPNRWRHLAATGTLLTAGLLILSTSLG